MCDDDEYGLVMPFVTVASKGGPHDDRSYVAGYTMGLLDIYLKLGEVDDPAPIPSDCLPQADLLALKHGYTMEAEPGGVPGWHMVSFAKAALLD